MINPEMLAKSGSEHGHQAAVMCWANKNIVKYPDLKWLTAIPNGGMRDKITAAKLKAEGVKSGVPDLLLLVARGSYAALWIELKRQKSEGKSSGAVGIEQVNWIKQAQLSGHAAAVCYGWISAVEVLQSYLELK